MLMDTQARKQAISRVMVLRTGILPPYCYDEDEGDKDADAYLEFYAQVGEQALIATEDYTSALREIDQSLASKAAFRHLAITRQKFIESFPFCYDELEEETAESKELLMQELERVYSKLSESKALINLLGYLEEYKVACQQLVSKI